MDEIREEVHNESVERANDLVYFIQEHPFTVLLGCIGLCIGAMLDDKLRGGK